MAHLFQKLPSLSGLVAFEAAMRHNSFTRAADELALSQASVSRRIRELEEDLGVTLFERRRYDVEPTEHGTRLARTARPALNEIADTVNQIRQVNAADNTVCIFSDLCLGSSLVAPVIGDFQRAHPDVDLRVLSSYQRIETTTEDFDIGLQYGAWAPERYHIEPLIKEHLYPVCSPAIAKKLGKNPTPEDLLKFPLIHLDAGENRWSSWAKMLSKLGIDDTSGCERLRFDSYQVCLDVAEEGDGIALGWETTVQDRINRGGLVAVESMRHFFGDTVNLYRPRHRTLSAPAKAFLDIMMKRIPDASIDL